MPPGGRIRFKSTAPKTRLTKIKMGEGEINPLSEICLLLIKKSKACFKLPFLSLDASGMFPDLLWFSVSPLWNFQLLLGVLCFIYSRGASWCPAVPKLPGAHLSLSPEPPGAPARGWGARQGLALGGSQLSFAFVKHNLRPAPLLLPPNQMKYLLGWSVRAQCFVCRGTGESWF